MRILIVGGGKVGSFLARGFSHAGHVVSVVETDAERARKVVTGLKVLVFEGDGTDVKLLEAAEVGRSDWVLAVTGRDEDNLVAAQLGKALGAANILARLNDPANRPTFEALEINSVAVTDLMADVITREVDVQGLVDLPTFAAGVVGVIEVDVPATFPESRVADLDLPAGSVVVTVGTGDEVQVARGNTIVGPSDHLVIAAKVDELDAVHQALELGGSST